jgi:hypothetical protein
MTSGTEPATSQLVAVPQPNNHIRKKLFSYALQVYEMQGRCTTGQSLKTLIMSYFTKLNTNQSPYHHPIPQILPSSLPLPSSQQVQSLQLLQQQELKEIHKA